MGRSQRLARGADEWVIGDIGQQSEADWERHLAEVDVVVNAAGALQDGARDSLTAIHETAVTRIAAVAKSRRFVQISAAGVAEDASTEFMRSKARGDKIIAQSDMEWTILRPTLVIGANAYGGTALLRGVAGLPGVGPKVFTGSAVQTINLVERAEAVADCALDRMPARQVYDLTEPEKRGFGDTVDLTREWLGFAPFAVRLPVPTFVMSGVSMIADGLGWLGWRSPLRSAAVRTLAEGVQGDPTAWRAAGGRDFSALPKTLEQMQATLQERWFARMFLMMPLSIAILSLFWLLSGIIGLWQYDAAVSVLTERGFGGTAAAAAVSLGALADMALGAAVLYRPWAKRACIGMILLALSYVAGASIFATDLWADPLGPLVKVLPSVGLALVAHGMLEDR